MKLVLLMYLREDARLVAKLLQTEGITAWSRLEAQGWTPGLPSPWSGGATPSDAEFVVTLLPEDRAESLMRSVDTCEGCADPRHPIHAVELDVTKVSTSRTPTPDSTDTGHDA